MNIVKNVTSFVLTPLLLLALLLGGLSLVACGGGDDDDDKGSEEFEDGEEGEEEDGEEEEESRLFDGTGVTFYDFNEAGSSIDTSKPETNLTADHLLLTRCDLVESPVIPDAQAT